MSHTTRADIVKYRDDKLIGTPDSVAKQLQAWHARGELIATNKLQPVPNTDLVAVAVRLVATTPPPEPAPQPSRAPWIVAGTVAATGATVAVGYFVYEAIMEVLSWLPVIGGLAVLLLIGWIVLGQQGACPGLHCPGCKCGR